MTRSWTGLFCFLMVLFLAQAVIAKTEQEPEPDPSVVAQAQAQAGAVANLENHLDLAPISTYRGDRYEWPVSTAAAIYGTRCNNGASYQGSNQGLSINTGNEVCDFDTVMRGYLALDAVIPDHQDEDGYRPIDKAVQAQDLGFGAAKRRNILGAIRDYLTLGLL